MLPICVAGTARVVRQFCVERAVSVGSLVLRGLKGSASSSVQLDLKGSVSSSVLRELKESASSSLLRELNNIIINNI